MLGNWEGVDMNAKQFAEEMKKTIAELKAKGVEAIKCENIIAYLEEVMKSPEDEPRPIDVEKYKADLQRWIDASRYEHESNLEMFRSVIASGQGAIKSSFLLNGGAAVALLAFIAHLAQFDKANVPTFGACLVYFALGALAIVITSGFTYLCQWFYASDRAWGQKVGFGLNVACILLGIGSYGIFAWGLFATYSTFVAYG